MADEQQFIKNLNLAGYNLTFYTVIIISNVGILANILNILLSLRKRIYSKSNMGFYNILISVANIISFSTSYVQYLPPIVKWTNLLLVSNFSCIIINYSVQVAVRMSSWINVMISIDRMVCVCFPNKFMFLNKKKNILIILFGLFVSMTIFSGLNAFLKVINIQTSFNYTTNTSKITPFCTSNKNALLIRDIIGIFTRSVLPIVLQIISSTIILHTLIKSRKNINLSRSMKNEYKFAFTILILNALFIISQTPLIVSLVYLNVIGYDESAPVNTSQLAIGNFFHTATVAIGTYMFISIFFVNMIFNKIYRRELFSTLIGMLNFLLHKQRIGPESRI